MLLTPLATPEDLRRWDSASGALGLPEFTLMENAARAAFDVLRQHLPDLTNRRVLCFMGGGNNGGDAACLARHMHDAGARVLVLHTKALGTLKGAARQHARLSKACGVLFRLLPVNIESALDRLNITWHDVDIIVDGLLGTGFVGTLRPPIIPLVRALNTASTRKNPPYILALDVPTGLNAMTGRPCPDAVRATATVTFAAATPGLVVPEARPYTGTLHVRDIGIPRCVREARTPSYYMLDSQCATLLPPLPANAHKNRFGHVLIIGGVPGMTGAAHLAALAALRAGAGLVTVAAPALSLPAIGNTLPEVMSLACGEHSWPEHIPEHIHNALHTFTSIVIGPGMGMAPGLLEDILRQEKRPPVVCDADALNTLASHRSLLSLLRMGDICTPHPAEAARLCATDTVAIQANRFTALRTLTHILPCVVALKGAATLISQNNEPICIAPWDIPALAVAGSGDVLAGCAGAWLARGMNALEATILAVSAHARAGMLCAEQYPQPLYRGILATELAHNLPRALASLHCLPNILEQSC